MDLVLCSDPEGRAASEMMVEKVFVVNCSQVEIVTFDNVREVAEAAAQQRRDATMESGKADTWKNYANLTDELKQHWREKELPRMLHDLAQCSAASEFSIKTLKFETFQDAHSSITTSARNTDRA